MAVEIELRVQEHIIRNIISDFAIGFDSVIVVGTKKALPSIKKFVSSHEQIKNHLVIFVWKR